MSMTLCQFKRAITLLLLIYIVGQSFKIINKKYCIKNKDWVCQIVGLSNSYVDLMGVIYLHLAKYYGSYQGHPSQTGK
jgi:hypothetical protein